MDRSEKQPAVLFVDFYNTLTTDSYWSEFDDDVVGRVEDFLYTNQQGIFTDWMRGDYTNREVISLLADEFDYGRDRMWSQYTQACRSVSIDSEITNALENISKNVKLILTTDNFGCFDRIVVPKNELLDKFDAIYNSYNYGSLKNDNEGEMFCEIADQQGISLESACLVEDQQAICNTFENLGGDSIHIDSVENTAKALTCLVY